MPVLCRIKIPNQIIISHYNYLGLYDCCASNIYCGSIIAYYSLMPFLIIITILLYSCSVSPVDTIDYTDPKVMKDYDEDNREVLICDSG